MASSAVGRKRARAVASQGRREERDERREKRRCVEVRPLDSEDEAVHFTPQSAPVPLKRAPVESASVDVFVLLASYLGAVELSHLACTGSHFITSALTRLDDVRWSMPCHPNADNSFKGLSLIFGGGCGPYDTPNPRHKTLRHLLVSQPGRMEGCRRCQGHACVMGARLPSVNVVFSNVRSLVVDARMLVPHVMTVQFTGNDFFTNVFPILESLVVRADPVYPFQRITLVGSKDIMARAWRCLLSDVAYPSTLREIEVKPNPLPAKGGDRAFTPLLFDSPSKKRDGKSYYDSFLSNMPDALETLMLPCLSASLSVLERLPRGLKRFGVATFRDDDLDSAVFPVHRFDDLVICEGDSIMSPERREIVRQRLMTAATSSLQ